MKYKKFTISHYKGIENPLEVPVTKGSLIPIIGVNECGKTTILQGIFSFDYYNDSLNSNIRHLEDTENLYSTSPDTPSVSAEIEVSKSDLNKILAQIKIKEAGTYDSVVTSYKRNLTSLGYSGSLVVERNLKTKKYAIKIFGWNNKDLNHLVARKILAKLPYILFFDDFRDSVDDKIEILDSDEPEGWLAIVEKLFKATNADFSVLDVPKKEDRARKAMLSQVNKTLETTLTREWKNFRLEDNKDALKIKIDYEKEGSEESGFRHFLKFDVIEQDADGHEYFFYVRDRSKGFYWFFNFVMKLEFNPKVVSSDEETVNAIYLLDEPGSYLHASAQTKLCNKLQQLSEKNTVIYCTHSHYLLDPQIIPISSIKVAVKDTGNFVIDLKSIHEYKGDISDRRSAFQPIIDALEIKPFILEFSGEKVVIVEGIYDYYCFELFKDKSDIVFLPSVNADSIKYMISLMIAWKADYRALWDADDEGLKHLSEAADFFGEEEAKRFHSLPLNGGKKVILQSLFENNDLVAIRTSMEIPLNSSFEKTILALYYAPKKEQQKTIKLISKETKDNFKEVLGNFDD